MYYDARIHERQVYKVSVGVCLVWECQFTLPTAIGRILYWQFLFYNISLKGMIYYILCY